MYIKIHEYTLIYINAPSYTPIKINKLGFFEKQCATKIQQSIQIVYQTYSKYIQHMHKYLEVQKKIQKYAKLFTNSVQQL